MMSWEKRIGGCFGDQDGNFAVHPLDEERAFDLLKILREQGIRWSVAKKEFRDFMKREKFSQAVRKEQEKRIRKKFKPWL